MPLLSIARKQLLPPTGRTSALRLAFGIVLERLETFYQRELDEFKKGTLMPNALNGRDFTAQP